MTAPTAPLKAAIAAASTAVGRHARALPGFDARVQAALQCLRDAAREHQGRVVQATSLGVEDMVITDLIARERLPIPLATLDTGMLHDETLALVARIESHYGLAVERWRPSEQRVVEFVDRHGELPMRRSVELRKACCALRKLEPLGRMLEGRDAWITGLRREQSEARSAVELRVRDEAGRVKLSPLADWHWADVWHYVALHGVPYNALHDQHYPSIGCAPCTRAITLGEDMRAGRWWWEQESVRECGLHVSALAPATPHAEATDRAALTSEAQR